MIQDNVVKYLIFRHKVTVSDRRYSQGIFNRMAELDRWCEENVGKGDVVWVHNELTFSGKISYHFDREEDAILFALKWV